MSDPNTPFSEPVVCTTNPQDWFIFFEYFYAGKWHKRKLREGINRIKDKKQRRKEAEVLAEQRHEWLKEGWNPITDPEFKARNIVQVNTNTKMNFCEALDFALRKKKPDVAGDTYTDYRNILDIVKEMAEETGLKYLPVSQVNRRIF